MELDKETRNLIFQQNKRTLFTIWNKAYQNTFMVWILGVNLEFSCLPDTIFYYSAKLINNPSEKMGWFMDEADATYRRFEVYNEVIQPSIGQGSRRRRKWLSVFNSSKQTWPNRDECQCPHISNQAMYYLWLTVTYNLLLIGHIYIMIY